MPFIVGVMPCGLRPWLVTCLLIENGLNMVQYFFGSAFLPSVEPLTILLPGIVALSVSKVLSSDPAGKGRPEFNA